MGEKDKIEINVTFEEEIDGLRSDQSLVDSWYQEALINGELKIEDFINHFRNSADYLLNIPDEHESLVQVKKIVKETVYLSLDEKNRLKYDTPDRFWRSLRSKDKSILIHRYVREAIVKYQNVCNSKLALELDEILTARGKIQDYKIDLKNDEIVSLKEEIKSLQRELKQVNSEEHNETSSNTLDQTIKLIPSREVRLGITDAPITFDEWKKNPDNELKTPIDCLKDVYGHWMEEELIYQDDIGGKNGLDPKLMLAVRSYMSNHKLKAEDVTTSVPPPKSKRIRRYVASMSEDKKKSIRAIHSAISRYNP